VSGMATYADAQRIVESLPGTSEVDVPAWGHPTFRVNGKMFAGGSPDSPTMSVKASKEEQAVLVAERPDTFYVGRYGWVRLELSGVDTDELRELLVEAWRRTAPKKLVRSYDDEGGSGASAS
jgi:hypothetical protein